MMIKTNEFLNLLNIWIALTTHYNVKSIQISFCGLMF